MIIILLFLLLLAGCGGDDNAPPPRPPQPPPGSPPVWQFQFSPGMSLANPYGNDGFSFIFPTTGGSVNYLVRAHGGALSGAISMTYSIDAPEGVVFDYRTNPDNTCGPGFPGTVTAYFHMANDSTMANEFGRWFASGYAQELKAGSFVLAAPFYSDPSKWVSVYGKNGANFLPQFQAALANVAEVGLTFGGGCFAGHGVFVTGGTAAMAASSFTAN